MASYLDETEELDHLVALHYQYEEIMRVPEESVKECLRKELELNEMIDEEVAARMCSMRFDHSKEIANNLDQMIEQEINKIKSPVPCGSQGQDEEEDLNLELLFNEKVKQQIDSSCEEFINEQDNVSEQLLPDPVSEIKDQELISEQRFKCLLCLEYHSIEMSESFGCSHIFCQNCLIGYFNSKIQEGNVLDIKCPGQCCTSIAPEFMIRSLVSIEMISKYETFVLKKVIDKMDDVMNCPQCNDPVECDLSTCLGSCEKCGFFFCTSCRTAYHGSDDCPNVTQRIEENEKTEQFIQDHFKKCPGCSVNVEQDIGCNHMICANCSTQFCWLCLTQLTGNPSEIERHYSSCVLFDHDFIT